MDRPLRGMSAEECERLLHEDRLRRHLIWCAEIRDVTLDVLSGPDREAARRSFAHAAGTQAQKRYEAKAKLQQYGQIHAWAVSARRGLPVRYQEEGLQIVDSFMRGVSWGRWRPWEGNWSPRNECKSEFRNPYVYRKHLPRDQKGPEPHCC